MRVPLSAFYFSTFGALGAFLPFLPLLLKHRGMTPTEISRVMLLLPIAAICVPALWGVVADRLRVRVGLLRAASLGCSLTVLLMVPRWGFLGSMIALGVFCFFRAPVITLADAATHAALKTVGHQKFAAIRVWGSIGFALVAWLVGELDASTHPTRMLGAAAGVYFIGFVATMFMRAPALAPQPRVLRRALTHVLGSPLPILFLGTVLHYIGQSTFDVYFGLHMNALGHDDGFVGLGWSVGVLFEIGLMFVAPKILARFDVRRLLIVGAAAAILRWTILSMAVTQSMILVGQSLHALTFGLWYLAMVNYVQQQAPEELRTTMQSFALTSMGVGTIIGYTIGGHVFETGGGQAAFQVAAATATLATLCYGFLATRRVAPMSTSGSNHAA